jgi:hypothetical protein
MNVELYCGLQEDAEAEMALHAASGAWDQLLQRKPFHAHSIHTIVRYRCKQPHIASTRSLPIALSLARSASSSSSSSSLRMETPSPAKRRESFSMSSSSALSQEYAQHSFRVLRCHNCDVDVYGECVCVFHVSCRIISPVYNVLVSLPNAPFFTYSHTHTHTHTHRFAYDKNGCHIRRGSGHSHSLHNSTQSCASGSIVCNSVCVVNQAILEPLAEREGKTASRFSELFGIILRTGEDVYVYVYVCAYMK